MEWNFLCALNTIHEGIGMMRSEREKDAKGTNGNHGEAKVILTGSVLSMMGFVGYSSYSPSKYAIRGKSRALSDSLSLPTFDG